MPTNTANFNNAAVFQPNLASTVSIQQLNFNSAASGYTLTSSPSQQFNLANAQFLTSSATSGFNTVSAAINLTVAANGTQGVNVSGAAPLVWNGPITATNSGVLIAKQGSGTLFMGSNSYDGPFGFNASAAAGTIVINSIGNVNGGASSLGAPTTAASGTIQIVSAAGTGQTRLRYVGGTTTTDRGISFTGPSLAAAGFMLQASGSGPLTWAGNLDTSGAGQRHVWLSGISEAANTFSGTINAGGGGGTFLYKNGAGNWTLTGSNTYGGGTYINGGTLTVDYQNGGALPASGNLNFAVSNGSNVGFNDAFANGGGTLRLVAKSSGATTQTVGSITVLTGGGAGGGAAGGQQRIVLDPNGGSGITLTAGAFTSSNFNLVLLDLPTGATLTTTTTGLTNSLFISGGGAGNILVRDSSSIGFATLSSGSIVRYTGATALAASTNNGTGNFSTSGDLTMTAGVRAVYSLDVDTTGGGTLNLGNQSFSAPALLFRGSGDYTMSSGTITGVVSSHQHSTGLVTRDTITPVAGATRKGGAGTLAVTARSGTEPLGIYDGALRANGATVYTAGPTALGTGGVLELGAAGNFTQALGTAAGQIRWTGDGGFSAFGAERTVQIGGNTNTLTWGVTNFVPDDNALVLSNVASDNTINFQNGLEFGTQQRLVRVANGSAAIDAKLSGVLSGNYGGGLYKTGLGTLELTAANTYLGETWVREGGLLVATAGSVAGSATAVSAGAFIGGDGTISGNLALATGALFAFETGSTLDLVGALSLDPAFGVNSLVSTSGGTVDWANVPNTTYTLMNTSFGFNASTISNFGVGNQATGLAGGKSAYFEQGTGSLQLVVVPEPAALALAACGLGLAGLAAWRRREKKVSGTFFSISRPAPDADQPLSPSACLR